MQDSTAESIKSLEGFDIASVEEAQTLSARPAAWVLRTRAATGVATNNITGKRYIDHWTEAGFECGIKVIK